jgi:hypothetical protein
MASGYVINIGNASANQWVQLNYEKTLNGVSSGQIGFDGVNSAYFDEFDVNKEIEIYKNGVGKFKGIIIDQDSMNGGGMVLSFNGIELELTDDNAPMVGDKTTRVWTATSDEAILSVLVTSVSGWSVDFTNSTSATVSSFRTSASDSIWNCIIRLIEQTGKDIYVNQFTRTIYLYDELTRADKFSFIEGKNSKDISRVKSRSKAGKVLVYGKGDGENQIIGSYGSSKPVETIIDRNVISPDEADNRAEQEYNRLNPEGKTYKITPTNYPSDLELGDAGSVANNSARINDTVHIVRLVFSIDGNGTEKLTLEVTNPELRLADKNNAEDSNSNQNNYDQSQSSMQGSGNTLTWSGGINAKSGTSLKLPFYVPSSFVEDQAGNIRVNSMTLDYDVDPFRSDIGTATETSVAPSLSSGSTDNHNHNVSDLGHEHDLPTMASSSVDFTDYEGTDSGSLTFTSTGWNTSVCTEAATLNQFVYVLVEITTSSGGSGGTVAIRVQWRGTTEAKITFPLGPSDSVIIPFFIYLGESGYSANIDLDIYNPGLNISAKITIYDFKENHSHSITGYDADSNNSSIDEDNKSPGLSGNAASHNHSVNIGDDVSESGSVNATSVSLYLDYWNGTSWVQKHSIASTGVIIDEDVDMTNSGTYPDVSGWWRYRVEPNSALPDYIQTICKIKHNLEND